MAELLLLVLFEFWKIPGERVSQEVQTEETVPSGAPIYIRAMNVLPNEVDLVWQAPTCLQTNGEITEYEYEAKPVDKYGSGAGAVGAIKKVVRGTKTRIINLSPYTKYEVRMRAYTRRGPGPWSEPIQFQTAAAPEVSFIN